MSRVSVIMPAYNAEKYIAESIESVLAQTFRDWELIIVDDGSSDNTASIAQSFVSQDNRIQYIWQKNGGQGNARNTAIARSKGDYLAFLDADDVWLPEKLTLQLELIQRTNADLVFSNAYMFGELPLDKNSPVMGLGDVEYVKEEVLDLFLRGNRVMILTVLVGREAVSEVNGFSEDENIRSAEDYHLWLKLLIANKIFHGTTAVLAAYRLVPGSSSSEDRFSTLTSMEVLKDISTKYPALETLIKARYKEWIKKSLGLTTTYSRKKYDGILKSNFKFIKYERWLSFIRFCDIVFGRKASIRTSYFILNYL